MAVEHSIKHRDPILPIRSCITEPGKSSGAERSGISRPPPFLAAAWLDARVRLSFADQRIQNLASAGAQCVHMDPVQWCF